MFIGMLSYGFLAYVIAFDYAYLTSLLFAFSTFCILMWFEAPYEDFVLEAQLSA
jgi:hypothetical protein